MERTRLDVFDDRFQIVVVLTRVSSWTSFTHCHTTIRPNTTRFILLMSLPQNPVALSCCLLLAFLPVWSGWIKPANSTNSRALNTSDADMLLCCLEVETSCVLCSITVFPTHRQSGALPSNCEGQRDLRRSYAYVWSAKAPRWVESHRSKKAHRGRF